MWFLIMMVIGDDSADDESLIARFQNGDARSLGVLYDRHARPLRAFVARRGAQRPDDVVQDAFVRIARDGAEFRGRSSFRTWLYSIARNLCIDASRRDRFRNMASLDAPLGPDRTQTLGDRVAHTGPESDAARTAGNRQFRVAFEQALAELPEEQREVFVMRELSGMAFAEIAEVTACNENTVKSRMRYALKALRDALGEFA